MRADHSALLLAAEAFRRFIVAVSASQMRGCVPLAKAVENVALTDFDVVSVSVQVELVPHEAPSPDQPVKV